ncbi:hypothetical protein FQN60_016822 [Etheostoma spectabile]|uniref:Uncharacterized protein n=1 Tax=Etheostoma spectabile TaxID=54343 RepID=A0A5J5CCV6_9PERO|nr:hypothetical protein FQN60_016822 [Etheostoma spectabile]
MTLSSEFEASQHAALPLEDDEIDIVGENEPTHGRLYRNECSTDPGSSAESGAEKRFKRNQPEFGKDGLMFYSNLNCYRPYGQPYCLQAQVSPPPAAPIRYMPLQEGIMMPPSYHLQPQTLTSHRKCSGPKDIRAQICAPEPPGPQAKCSFSIDSIMSKPSPHCPQHPNPQQSPRSALGTVISWFRRSCRLPGLHSAPLPC